MAASYGNEAVSTYLLIYTGQKFSVSVDLCIFPLGANSRCTGVYWVAMIKVRPSYNCHMNFIL